MWPFLYAMHGKRILVNKYLFITIVDIIIITIIVDIIITIMDIIIIIMDIIIIIIIMDIIMITAITDFALQALIDPMRKAIAICLSCWPKCGENKAPIQHTITVKLESEEAFSEEI